MSAFRAGLAGAAVLLLSLPCEASPMPKACEGWFEFELPVNTVFKVTRDFTTEKGTDQVELFWAGADGPHSDIGQGCSLKTRKVDPGSLSIPAGEYTFTEHDLGIAEFYNFADNASGVAGVACTPGWSLKDLVTKLQAGGVTVEVDLQPDGSDFCKSNQPPSTAAELPSTSVDTRNPVRKADEAPAAVEAPGAQALPAH